MLFGVCAGLVAVAVNAEDAYCPQVNIWPRTAASVTVNKRCPPGWSGTKSRMCTKFGFWRSVQAQCVKLCSDSQYYSKAENMCKPIFECDKMGYVVAAPATITKDAICGETKSCVCDTGGTPATGKLCPQHRSNACASCFRGYALRDKVCVLTTTVVATTNAGTTSTTTATMNPTITSTTNTATTTTAPTPSTTSATTTSVTSTTAPTKASTTTTTTLAPITTTANTILTTTASATSSLLVHPSTTMNIPMAATTTTTTTTVVTITSAADVTAVDTSTKIVIKEIHTTPLSAPTTTTLQNLEGSEGPDSQKPSSLLTEVLRNNSLIVPIGAVVAGIVVVALIVAVVVIIFRLFGAASRADPTSARNTAQSPSPSDYGEGYAETNSITMPDPPRSRDSHHESGDDSNMQRWDRGSTGSEGTEFCSVANTEYGDVPYAAPAYGPEDNNS